MYHTWTEFQSSIAVHAKSNGVFPVFPRYALDGAAVFNADMFGTITAIVGMHIICLNRHCGADELLHLRTSFMLHATASLAFLRASRQNLVDC